MMENQAFLELLRQELRPALGCTEPIAVAYCASRAREILGGMPEHIRVECSGNIIKNAMGVIVPGTEHLRGVNVSAVLGAVAGDPALQMEVLRNVTSEDVMRTQELIRQGICEVHTISEGPLLQIRIRMNRGEDTSLVEIRDTHTNIVWEQHNGETIFRGNEDRIERESHERQRMRVDEIIHFADQVPLEELTGILAQQVNDNMIVAEEGIRGNYGAQVGKTLLAAHPDNLRQRAIAMAAAGSDARMSGCLLPVVINSGSGNQGMTVSIPVVVYGRGRGMDQERIYRALAVSNLVALYQKSYIGELSAYCGVISASCGAVAGIAYLEGESLQVISDTITNTIAVVSGIVCDGAKPSCAAKIAAALQAGFLALDLAREQRVFHEGEGLVRASVDGTIAAYGKMGAEGMRETDQMILQMMIDES